MSNEKEWIGQFLDAIVNVLKDKKESGTHKFYAMRLLVDTFQTYKAVIVNKVASNSELLSILKQYAQYKKESKQDDRGAQIFGSKEDPIIGIQFHRLILEAIQIWGNKFPKDGKGNPTKFQIIQTELTKEGVTFPQDYLFLSKPNQLSTSQNQPQQQRSQSQHQQPPSQPQQQPQQPMSQTQNTPQPETSDPKVIKYKYFKLFENILEDLKEIEGTLKENEEVQEFVTDILNSYNTTLREHIKQLDKIINEGAQHDNLFTESESAKQFQLRDLMNNYTTQFQEMEQTGFLDSAYLTFRIMVMNQIREFHGKPPEKPPQKQQQQTPQLPKQEQPHKTYTDDSYLNQSQKLPIKEYLGQNDGYNNKREQPETLQLQSKQPDYTSTKTSQNQPPYQNRNDSFQPRQIEHQEPMNQDLYQSKPIHPSNQGKISQSTSSNYKSTNQTYFGQNQQLSNPMEKTTNDNYTNQQKQSSNNVVQSNVGILNFQPKNAIPQQQPKPRLIVSGKTPSPQQYHKKKNRYGTVEDFSEKFDVLSMSTMSVRDFPQKNQPVLDHKKYSGYLVPYDPRPYNFFFQMGLSDNQLRRLKVSTLKKRASIFESHEIQIGAISRLIYHETTNRYYLKMTLVFGNKSREPMKNCEIDYQGDYGLTLWTQDPYLDSKEGIPRRDDGIDLAPKQQLYQPLALHYNTVPFQTINGVFSWQDEQTKKKANFILPCLLPKFMNFIDTDPLVFKQKWHYKKSQMIKSEIIEFNPKIIRTPNFFLRYFPELIELSTLEEFIAQETDKRGYFKDYKLGGTFTLQSPKIEFMIKIIVRQNLTGLFKIVSYFSYQSQAEKMLNNLVFIFGMANF